MKLFVAVFLIASVAALDSTPVLMFSRGAAPAQWHKGMRASPTEIVPFHVAIKQRNIDVLDAKLMDVSDPNSPNYAQWMEIDDIMDLIAPPRRVVDMLKKWVKNSGAKVIQDNRDVIYCSASASIVEELFNTELYEFVHEARDVTIIRSAGEYYTPSWVADHIDLIIGITEFPNLRHGPQTADPSNNDVSQGYVIPAVLRNVYNVPAYANASQSSVCVAEFQQDTSYAKSDLSTFLQECGEPSATVNHIVGPYDGSEPNAESTLDIEYASAMATNAQNLWFWTVDQWMYEFANELYQTNPAPLVVSMSWGWPENEQCQLNVCNGSTTKVYVQRVNNEFLKITMRGISLLASSGDQGAPGDGNAYCSNSDAPLSTIFPGASPYVTSVGATMLSANGVASPWAKQGISYSASVCSSFTCATTTKEAVCTYPDALITTGGGFSDYVPRPSWQSKAVQNYLNTASLPPSQYFSSANRAFPDVSALGHAYVIYMQSQNMQVDGTSCSSPVMAGLIADINSARKAAGKASVGFLNTALYTLYDSNPSAFKDITTGNNKCTESCCATYGFNAAAGWDPVVGLGTPNFEAWQSYFLSLK